MKAADLNDTEYIPYFQTYINKLGDLVLLDSLEDGLEKTINFFQSIPEDKHEYRYAEGKWTIKEIINHLIDSERVFCYRALRFSRNDTTPLSGFDHDDYVLNSNANKRTVKALLEEYSLIRQATIKMFQTFDSSVLKLKGQAGSGTVSVRALGFLIAGHEKHHCQIVEERYL
ncbi:DinB family protein [Lacinutrix sp. MedPE-SW]|uniref:DinB family protein n=1 Tax=Lacinutrix sp. MedPE-SW TaxID=1860087 RepID=UPI0009213C31|nr:DinB family protein [Lacinutrix sp. MedPE-SW]OIQ23915.1 MAG: damage-inducible protein DinB [Lacinutrix sp. MedPE-SW]